MKKTCFYFLCIFAFTLSFTLGGWSLEPPYPPSPVITGVEWAPASQIIRLAKGSDNWPLTWADDGALYSAYGDGYGFQPHVPKKLSLGFAKILGSPPDIQGINIRSETGEQIGDGAQGKKASGLLFLDGVLYMWARNAGNSQLAWSSDDGKSWTWADWKFTESFGCPTFLRFGRHYEGARDSFVYIVSHDSDSAYEAADRMVMARVSQDQIKNQDRYEFFMKINESGSPIWTRDIRKRGAVFTHPRRCYRSGLTYNPALKRYLWSQTLPGGSPRFEGGFGVYDAPEPWGPWTTVFFTERWDVGPGETSSLPVKWMSADGRTAYLVFSGDDCFSVRKLTFQLADSSPRSSMIFPDDEWIEAAPESQGIDAGKLNAAAEFLKANSGKDGVRELAVVRNGRLVWKGDNIDKTHGVWSLTKSFTSTVLGLLIDEGKTSLDALACEYLPSLKEHYSGVTLRHFTTMTSGYRAIGDEPRSGYTHGPSSTPFLPNPTPLFAPGVKYAYWDSAMNQFANVLTRIAREPLKDYFKRKIADPIGMNPDQWTWGDFGLVDDVAVNGGSGNSNNHIFISARELARFGLLFLNRGNWNGRQLISSEWVDEVHQPHVPASMPLGHPESGIDGRGVYGFNWWLNGVKADGKRKWPDAPAGVYSASGYNNNDLFIIPEWNMVVVRLGLDQGEAAITDDVYNTFLYK
ncbi:MAG: serine hydrolase, partial [Candidatus Hinthialibacter sp.]